MMKSVEALIIQGWDHSCLQKEKRIGAGTIQVQYIQFVVMSIRLYM